MIFICFKRLLYVYLVILSTFLNIFFNECNRIYIYIMILYYEIQIYKEIYFYMLKKIILSLIFIYVKL